jgi:hypothetical protein
VSTQTLIAVVGATGSQGGGLVRAILADPDHEFAVRALTRDPASDKASELATAGAEVVAADLDDAASMRAAFEGAHGICRDELLGTPLSRGREGPHPRRNGAGAGRDSRTGSQGRRCAARDLVHLGGHPGLLRRRRSGADRRRTVQSSALRRQERGGRTIHRPRCADVVPAHHLLLRRAGRGVRPGAR